MIIRNIYHKIEIHFLFYLISFLALITGNFKNFCLFMSLLIIHECGHVLAGLYYKWNIEKVVIFPFGALTIFKDHLNKPIKEEFFIVIMGPLFQCLFYFLLSSYQIPHLESFHYGLLFFNLLPIVPLDGSKLANLIYQRFFSYWSSYYFSLFLSLCCFVYLCYQLKFSLVFFLILCTLIFKVISYFNSRYSLFSKFIMERLLYSFTFKRRKIIFGKNIRKMKRDTQHLFYISNMYYTEREFLQKRFDFTKKKC